MIEIAEIEQLINDNKKMINMFETFKNKIVLQNKSKSSQNRIKFIPIYYILHINLKKNKVQFFLFTGWGASAFAAN